MYKKYLVRKLFEKINMEKKLNKITKKSLKFNESIS